MDFLFATREELNYDYPLHDHGYWEILICTYGHGILTADGDPYAFHPGTIFCIRPGVKHTMHAENGYRDGAFLARDFCFDRLPDKVLVFQDDADQSFLSLYRLSQRYKADSDEDTPSSRFQRSILDAMQNLLRHWKDEAHMLPELAAFQGFLYANIADSRLDMDKAISATGYSPSHFRRLFREHFGCSPVQYCNQLRIHLAKEELMRHKTVLSIAQIAANCGFEDPEYFSRVFRQATGMSPTQFYQSSRNGLEQDQMISTPKN